LLRPQGQRTPVNGLGQQVNYKSAEKYIGSDTLELLVLFPGGFAREVHLDINVR